MCNDKNVCHTYIGSLAHQSVVTLQLGVANQHYSEEGNLGVLPAGNLGHP